MANSDLRLVKIFFLNIDLKQLCSFEFKEFSMRTFRLLLRRSWAWTV